MSEAEQIKEVAVIQDDKVIPQQVSATDTSNQDNKVSTDPSGEKYIRTLPED